MANLLVTLMDKMDVPVEQIGGSTGKLPIDTLQRNVGHATPDSPARRVRRRPACGEPLLAGGNDAFARPACRSVDAREARDREAVRALLQAGRERQRAGRRRDDGAALGELPRRPRKSRSSC